MGKTLTSLTFAAACLAAIGAMPAAHAQTSTTELVTNGPQASGGDFGDWSARRNVIESQHYEQLLASNPGFRHARMHKECGPISDPQLRADCFASFQQYEPSYGSSAMPRRERNPGAGD